LHAASLIIPVTAGGVPYGGDITISAVFQNIPTTYEITWGIVGASFVDAGTNQTKIVDVTTAFNDSVIVTVSVLFGGVTYTDMVTLTKVFDGKPAPMNFGGVTAVPTAKPDGDPLVKGDYFLWAGTTTATYTKGEIYEWDGDSWEKSTNGNLVMTMFDDFADLANDVDSTVIGNAVIKKLVAIEAFIENLIAGQLEVVNGTFRVIVNKSEGIKIEKDNIIVFSASPSGDLSITGNINANSGTFKGQLDTLTIKTYLGGDTSYPQSDVTTIEQLISMLIEFIGPNTSLKIDATINSLATQSVLYGNIIVTQHRILEIGGYTAGGERIYNGTSAIICTCSIIFTMGNGSTMTYVLRKIKGITNRWVGAEPVNYPPYPTPPEGITDLTGWSNFYIATGSSSYGTPTKPVESAFDGIGSARSFPYSITGIILWDSTRERLFIKNLPTSAPSESGRIWRDGTTLRIV
jgi:hypothetical protein